ncbi:2251_t:CDS:2, partial [Funneliformis caledonium]
MPTPHKFRNFFSLVPNPNNKSNAKAVCIFCSSKNGGVQAAALISGCFTTNKANLCRAHLANCIHFKNSYTSEEVEEILSQPVPEDKRKLNESNIDDNEPPPPKY